MKYPILLAAALLTAACVPEADPNDATLNRPDRNACGAPAYVGTIGTQHLKHDFTNDNRPLRIIAPNTPVTMDFRAERLNVDIDDKGIVTRVWCG